MEISNETPVLQGGERADKKDFLAFAKKLGFIESREMEQIRAAAVLLLKEDRIDGFNGAYARYDSLGAAIIESLPDKSASVHVGFLIMKASLFYEGGYDLSFRLEWDDVIEYAHGGGVNVYDLRVLGGK